MKQLLGVALAGLALSACTYQSGASTFVPTGAVTTASYRLGPDEVMIRSVVAAQARAWNRGDIDAFMQGYWQNDRLRFASGGTVTYGWQATLDRYKARYDTPEKMGQLSFRQIEVTQLAPDAAIMTGRWTLVRDADTPQGLFTLLFRKVDDVWVIVSDHTSSGAPE